MRYVLVFMAVFLCFAPQAGAQETPYRTAQFIPKIFKKDQSDNEPVQGETLRAPFADRNRTPDTGSSDTIGVPYAGPGAEEDNAKSLDRPHRTPEQIRRWLTEAITNILTFDPQRYDAHKEDIAAVMDPAAVAEFDSQMQDSNLLYYLETNNLNLASFVEPFNNLNHLQNQGVINGRYRWLYKIPVNLTFLPAGIYSYEDSTAPSKPAFIYVQVGRADPDSEYPDALVLESWDMKDRQDP